MRFLVVSDTHGDTNGLAVVLHKLAKSIDGLIHCGDGAQDAGLLLEAFNLSLPYWQVRGNTDSVTHVPLQRPLYVEERKILVTHGHQWLGHQTFGPLIAEARRQNAAVLLFGHTHVPFIAVEDHLLVLNPGSMSRPRGKWGPSFAIMDVPEEAGSWIDVRFFELPKGPGPVFRAFRP